MKLQITKEIELLEALSALLPDSSRNTLRGIARDMRVFVDGRVASDVRIKVRAGQEVEVRKKEKKEGELLIHYEDEHLIVIEKPAGLLSVATDFDITNTAHAILKNRYKARKTKVYVIHRLDQETSGLMVFALTEEAYHTLKQELMVHDVERIYYGCVHGELSHSGTWESYLKEDANYFVHASDNPAFGERAVTHYEPIYYKPPYTLVRFQLETGKKNQIRVQSATAGHAIVGDNKYGPKSAKKMRLFLHAAELHFTHPVSKKRLSFFSHAPPQFLSLLHLATFPIVRSNRENYTDG